MTASRRAEGAVRVAWLAAGWLLFGIGLIGVVLPGLPTTGPMLLALACFSKGSDRLHSWLLNHRIFGPPLRRWQQTHTIPLSAKITALLMMVGSIGIVYFFSGLSLAWRLGFIALIVVGMVVVVGQVCHARSVLGQHALDHWCGWFVVGNTGGHLV